MHKKLQAIEVGMQNSGLAAALPRRRTLPLQQVVTVRAHCSACGYNISTRCWQLIGRAKASKHKKPKRRTITMPRLNKPNASKRFLPDPPKRPTVWNRQGRLSGCSESATCVRPAFQATSLPHINHFDIVITCFVPIVIVVRARICHAISSSIALRRIQAKLQDGGTDNKMIYVVRNQCLKRKRFRRLSDGSETQAVGVQYLTKRPNFNGFFHRVAAWMARRFTVHRNHNKRSGWFSLAHMDTNLVRPAPFRASIRYSCG